VNETPAGNALVSIVLPTYNRARILPYAIQSVLAQTHSNLELIVIDDNSPDDTRTVVQSFNDARITYRRNQNNLKLPSSLNVGFELSRGDYLTWTSDDNMYERDAVRRMVERLESGSCDFVFADYYEFADLDAATGAPLDFRHVKLPDAMAVETGNRIGACFLYTRKVYETVGLYDPELFLVEDYDYFMRISRQFRLCHIAEPLYYFRRHEDSLYLSRFCEVKAADVLVRYRNGFLNEAEALTVVVELVMKNLERLHNPFLKWVYIALKDTSYRLTVAYKAVIRRYLASRLEREVSGILRSFDGKEVSFKDAKVALENLLRRTAGIQYS
jgi:glycosyltransferase involved in cell wall biosynthesis